MNIESNRLRVNPTRLLRSTALARNRADQVQGAISRTSNPTESTGPIPRRPRCQSRDGERVRRLTGKRLDWGI